MPGYLKRFVMFYWNPRRAASETLDHSRLVPVIFFAAGVVIALQAPEALRRQALTAELNNLTEKSLRASAHLQQGSASHEQRNGTNADFRVIFAASKRTVEIAKALEPRRARGDFRELAVIAGLFVPAAIALIVLWRGAGRCSTMLRQEYSPVLLCALTSWIAGRLPLIPIVWLGYWNSTVGSAWIVDWPAHVSTALFLIFVVTSLRVCLGTGWISAGTSVALGGVLLASAGLVSEALSPVLWVLASPCLLFYAWGHAADTLNSMGSSLSARQSLRQALEATTLNASDADAHFQLGLIQLQRGNLAEAEAHFRKAAAIDPSDADYAFRLGCVLRDRRQFEEALEWLSRAAGLDEKAAGYEVWRELGAAQLSLRSYEQGLVALDRYLNYREYDPAGLVYHAEALTGIGRFAEARGSYEKALEAIATMPRHRRGELRRWATRAKTGLRRAPAVSAM